MTEQFTQDILRGQNAWLVTAHPDDSLWYTSVIREAARIDEKLLNAGEKGINPENRVNEERAAAAILGIGSVVLYDGRDGALADEIDRFSQQLADDVMKSERRVGVLISSLLTDHAEGDHLAAGEITLEAARKLAKVGRAVGILLLHHDNEGDYTSRVTPDDMERTFRAARQHRQWRIQDGTVENWVITPAGHSMHPDDYTALRQYPLTRDASYTWLPPEHFLAEETESLALATR